MENEILQALSPSVRALVVPELKPVRLVADQVLYESGEEVRDIYFPKSGLISLMCPLGEGRGVENTSRGRDGAIGYAEALGSGRMSSRAVVQIKGAAWRLAKVDYLVAYEASGEFRSLLQRRIEYMLAESRIRSACRAVHPALERLARTLLECHQHTADLRLVLTQDYLAGLIGVGRTTVTHAAGRLQDLDLIRYTRGVVRILDLEGLQGQACECHGALRAARQRILYAQPASRS